MLLLLLVLNDKSVFLSHTHTQREGELERKIYNSLEEKGRYHSLNERIFVDASIS